MKDLMEVGRAKLAKEMASDIVNSERVGDAIQKWRGIFHISQRQLADEMRVMPSVISDYESGRRKSPGTRMVKKIIDTLIRIDEKAGWAVTKEFASLNYSDKLNDVIIDIRELKKPLTIADVAAAVEGNLLNKAHRNKPIYGYTIIDSIKAIIALSPEELVRLYGLTTERAMIFTGVSSGRSPFIAIKVTNLKPGVIVLHKIKEKLDPLAMKIAENENIPVILSNIDNVDKLVFNLRRI